MTWWLYGSGQSTQTESVDRYVSTFECEGTGQVFETANCVPLVVTLAPDIKESQPSSQPVAKQHGVVSEDATIREFTSEFTREFT